MIAESLVRDLAARGIRLSADRGELVVRAPGGALTDADRQAVRAHKAGLLELLTAKFAGPPGPDWAWRTEYIAELGRLVLLVRSATPDVAETLRTLCRRPVPRTCAEWVELGTAWRQAEADLRETDTWPPYPWDDVPAATSGLGTSS